MCCRFVLASVGRHRFCPTLPGRVRFRSDQERLVSGIGPSRIRQARLHDDWIYIYIYIYICMYVYNYIYIYIYMHTLYLPPPSLSLASATFIPSPSASTFLSESAKSSLKPGASSRWRRHFLPRGKGFDCNSRIMPSNIVCRAARRKMYSFTSSSSSSSSWWRWWLWWWWWWCYLAVIVEVSAAAVGQRSNVDSFVLY